MTIKQLGGIFGRNPTFEDVTIEGTLTFDGDIDISSDLKVDGDLDVTGTALVENLGVNTSSVRSGYRADIQGEGGNALNIQTGDEGADIILSLGSAGTPDKILVKAGGDIDMTNGGSILMKDGKGIDFSATSGTGTSELFDDYEEGESGALTMTPQTSGTITLNTSYDTFKYTKIGNRVTISGQFIVSSVSSPVGTRVTLPLPFTSASGQSNRAGTAALYYNGSGRTAIPCGVSESSTNLTVYLDASTIAAGHEFWFDVTYQAA